MPSVEIFLEPSLFFLPIAGTGVPYEEYSDGEDYWSEGMDVSTSKSSQHNKIEKKNRDVLSMILFSTP